MPSSGKTKAKDDDDLYSFLFYPFQHSRNLPIFLVLKTYPLSMPLTPIFSPMSPTISPGFVSIVSGLRIGTRKPCKPWLVPSGVIS